MGKGFVRVVGAGRLELEGGGSRRRRENTYARTDFLNPFFLPIPAVDFA